MSCASLRLCAERIDSDNSNSLSRKELTHILTVDFGLSGLSEEELEDAFAELDENNDGEISIEEFLQGMTNLKNPDAVQQRAARVLASRSKRRTEAQIAANGNGNGNGNGGGEDLLLLPHEIGSPGGGGGRGRSSTIGGGGSGGGGGGGEQGRGIALPWSQGLKYHFFLSHKQANGGQTMAWLEGKLSGRDLLSWYDNMQEDRSEAGMMAGVKGSAVFLLFLTEGTIERYFVQREMSEAFSLRKPFMLMYETDDRFGRPDFGAEMKAKRQKGKDGEYLLTEEQIAWLFGECVGIPVRREAHELSSMLEEIETHARNAIQGEPGKAKLPPPELCVQHTTATATATATAAGDEDEDKDGAGNNAELEAEPAQEQQQGEGEGEVVGQQQQQQQQLLDWEAVSAKPPLEWRPEHVAIWLVDRLGLAPEVGLRCIEECVDGSLIIDGEMDGNMWRELGAEGLAAARITRDLKTLLLL